MNFDEAGIRQALACVAALAGVGGVLCVLAIAPRRTSFAALVLLFAFGLLITGGAMGIRATPLLDLEWSDRLLPAGCFAVVVGVMLLLSEGRGRERERKLAVAEAETQRREVERLGGTNVRLEDELQDIRRRVTTAEKSGAGESELSRAARDAGAVRQRKAMEAAQSSERKHRAIFEGALEGMAMLERETLRLVTVNPSLCRMTGHEGQDLSQKTLVDLFVPGKSQPGKADLLRSAREGRALLVEIQGKDGVVTQADVSVTVIGSGAEAQLLTVVRDVSERRVLEQELQQNVRALKERERHLADANREIAERATHIEEMNEKLQETQRQKDHFVSTVSHELRTPLTSIRSFSEILLKHGDTEPSVRREFLEIINKESERLTRLVNNVLDLARIEAGEARLEITEFDIRDVITDAVASMTGMASEKKVAIRRELGEGKRALCGDRDKVQQLVMNLVSNAIKFSPQAGDVEVELKEGSRPGRMELKVTDHGPGIPQGELERVFEKFHQAGDTVPGAAQGTGLGLAISREIAKLHGGRVWAESTIGRGSVFRVDLPGLEETRRLFGPNRSSAPVASRTAPPSTGRVLKLRADAAPRPVGAALAAGLGGGIGSGLGDRGSERLGDRLGPPSEELGQRDWSETGSLPPLSPRMMKKSDGLSSTGELPPIR